MNALAAQAAALNRLLDKAAGLLQPLLLLLIRLWIFNVFFKSGLTKLDDWDTTVQLFTDEYHVPLLPPALAALMGTFGETVLSSLLALGLAGRFAAAGLFVVNAVAVISYPDLTDVTRQFHYYWAILIAVLFCAGPGQLSLSGLWRALRAPRQG